MTLMTATVSKVQIRTLLVAVDGSEYSEKALKYACAIAAPIGAELYVMYVVPMLMNATPYHDTISDQPFLALQKVGEDILARSKRLALELGCRVTDLISYGDPPARIIEVAEEKGVDLIVMGSRGISGLKRLFVGSTSDKVTRMAPCPVLIVR